MCLISKQVVDSGAGVKPQPLIPTNLITVHFLGSLAELPTLAPAAAEVPSSASAVTSAPPAPVGLKPDSKASPRRSGNRGAKKGAESRSVSNPSKSPRPKKTAPRSRSVPVSGSKKDSGKRKKQGKKGGTTGGRRSGGGEGKAKQDILCSAALENAHYTCHNVPDLLFTRGFQWPALAKGKKGKKKKRGGKKKKD
ncbi:unnamed protein product [Cyprideis torosa]|uniref:Uncharacterized protein n=1 Tax=Cyprideis torosa TaxID=163714 RepID=A0A7R8WAK5_9CRUS|nr:unnamed protein product [Cyprideis torosa]CAG0885945.1 unnamed protein product [Cyprideis torosa]